MVVKFAHRSEASTAELTEKLLFTKPWFTRNGFVTVAWFAKNSSVTERWFTKNGFVTWAWFTKIWLFTDARLI